MQRIFAPGLFANKVAMVTGGGTGIGFGTAAGLAQLGAKVVIASRSIDKSSFNRNYFNQVLRRNYINIEIEVNLKLNSGGSGFFCSM